VPKPSLPVKPGVLWRRKVAEYSGSMNVGTVGFLVRSGNQLAVTYLGKLRVFDLEARPLWESPTIDSHTGISGAAADTDGNYYQFLDKLVSYSPTGALRWSKPLPNMGLGGTHFALHAAIRGNTDLFFRGADGSVRRVDARTGQTVWESSTTARGKSLLAAGNGVWNNDGTFWDATTGEKTEASRDGHSYSPVATTHDGRLWALDRFNDGYRSVLLDACFRPLTAPRPLDIVAPPAVDLRERLWEVTGEPPLSQLLSAEAVVVSPKPMKNRPLLLGGDGLVYSESLIPEGAGYRSELHIQTETGAEVETIDVPGGFVGLDLTLGDDGVMHSTFLQKDGLYIVAIQTQSPGIADAPLPMALSDNRRSGWPKAH
jgi:hypothetical protein